MGPVTVHKRRQLKCLAEHLPSSNTLSKQQSLSRDVVSKQTEFHFAQIKNILTCHLPFAFRGYKDEKGHDSKVIP